MCVLYVVMCRCVCGMHDALFLCCMGMCGVCVVYMVCVCDLCGVCGM